MNRVTALLAAVALASFDQVTAWRYGVVGVLALLLLAIGIKADKPTCSALGALILALLITRPAS
ncbi:hypothetical protein [Streptomyces sp. NPDC001068]|uniref:hypothetical protein n=1 Tax=Streptomyces sp. NPDC001068 TaxID=3364544 RepID=UPI0036C7AD0E